jgi:type I restriction enzyme S subunit
MKRNGDSGGKTMAAKLKWPTKRLGELAEFRNGVNYNKSSFGVGIKVVGVSDFQDYTKPRYAELEQINPDGIVTERNILHDGDIVFVRSNGNRELIGRSLFIEQPPEEVTHSAFSIRLRFTSREVHPKFYAYCFRTPLIRQGLTAQGGGTNINNLNQDILNALEVPLPPLPVQQRIANILSAYDELIENGQRRIRILEDMARALYREWFVNFRFPGHENIKLVDSTLGKIPKGWKVKKLGEVTLYLNRGISPIYDENGSSTVINQKCIRDQRLSLEPARRQTKPIPTDKQVRFGDVLINSTGVGTLGRVAQVYQELGEYTVDTHVTLARQNTEVDLDFFGLTLLSHQETFDRLGVGATGQTELSRTSIANVELVVPPLAIQASYGEIARPMRKAAITLTTQIQNLRQTRDLLLPRLLSGQVELASANGAFSNQPGATPQDQNKRQNEG